MFLVYIYNVIYLFLEIQKPLEVVYLVHDTSKLSISNLKDIKEFAENDQKSYTNAEQMEIYINQITPSSGEQKREIESMKFNIINYNQLSDAITFVKNNALGSNKDIGKVLVLILDQKIDNKDQVKIEGILQNIKNSGVRVVVVGAGTDMNTNDIKGLPTAPGGGVVRQIDGGLSDLIPILSENAGKAAGLF